MGKVGEGLLAWTQRSAERSLQKVAKRLTKVAMPTNLIQKAVVKLGAKAARLPVATQALPNQVARL